MQLGTEVEISMIGTALAPGTKSLSIRQDPYKSSCSSTGDVFAPENGLTRSPLLCVRFLPHFHE